MLTSVWSPEIQAVLDQAESPRTERLAVGERTVEICRPFPSPADWRDVWIYQIVLDRFNNPQRPPRHAPWDSIYDRFQGGTLNGVRQQLDYLAQLGAGAIWLSPVLKNCPYRESYHGYGIQDFLVIDPRLASDPDAARANPQLVEDEFRALVEEAHARGMHVILDIVLNHCGDVFEYDGRGAEAPWRDWGEQPYAINWRDEAGRGHVEWHQPPPNPPFDGLVWPQELQRNEFFRRRGVGGEAGGDFFSLKEFVTDYHDFDPRHGHYDPVRDILIRAHQYLIARYDVDGFRIDTLKYIEADFARTFANAVRELALAIGKKNFFTFGEVYDNEEQIARFIGRDASAADEPIGVDAALDFPLFYQLPAVAKGFVPPAAVAGVFEHRKQVQRGLLSTHGDAGKFFVTFLDNHDQHQRFHFSDPGAPHQFDAQVTLALGCLFSLQGIPCVYYGTEQGLHTARERYTPGVDPNSLPPEAVREALWGLNGAGAFDRQHPFYGAIRQLARVRDEQPALRYGRQYFRPLSGNGHDFGISSFPQGVLAFSRILNDQEVVVVANAHTQDARDVEVIVDFALNPAGSPYRVLFSNRGAPAAPGAVSEKPGGSVTIYEVDGAVHNGPARVLTVHLQPMELQILGKTV